MTASDVCEEIRNKLQDTLLKGLGKAEDYGLFIADKNDAKKGSWLDPDKTLGYYCVENNVNRFKSHNISYICFNISYY